MKRTFLLLALTVACCAFARADEARDYYNKLDPSTEMFIFSNFGSGQQPSKDAVYKNPPNMLMVQRTVDGFALASIPYI